MAKQPTKKTTTRKEISRLKREKRQRQLILITVIVVITLIFGIIAFGILNEFVLEGIQEVANVNGEKISVNDFRKEMRYQRFQYIQQYTNYYQIYDALGAEVGASFLSNLQQIQFQLSGANAEQFGNVIMDRLIEYKLIEQYADANGITVSDDEINESIQTAFGFYENGTPTPTNTTTPFVTSTLSATQYSLVTPTTLPTTVIPTETKVTETIEANVTQTVVVENTKETTEAEGEATPLPTLEPTPTPTKYTFESFQTSFDNLLTQLNEIDYSEKSLRNTFRLYLLRQKVLDKITADILPEEEQVWARHILVEDEEIANQVNAKLESGEDWTSLASEYSTDQINKDKGGDLGWFGKGKMIAPFEEAAFQLEIGQISEPVETEFGWHIIQVLGHEVRPLSQSDFQVLRDREFQNWLGSQKEAEAVEKLDTWKEQLEQTPIIPPELILDN